MSVRRNWNEEEVRHALALYLRTDFGRFHSLNPDVIALANRLGRTAGAVALKLSNLAALDESLPQKGMANASKTDRRVWAEFLLAPERVLLAFAKQSDGSANSLAFGMAEAATEFELPQAGERKAMATQRIGQSFFRRMILTSYRGRCALTGIEDERLLNASHIVAWKDDPGIRVNPANGICLNALHDRAFDRHLITFDGDYNLVLSPKLPPNARSELERTRSNRLEMPTRFLPEQDFLERHRRQFFEGNA